MPIYEYECRQCGHRFEYLVLSSTPVAECPSCRNKELTQLISLCSMSSESTREANLNAAHKKAAGIQKEIRHEDHKDLHHHYDE